MWVKSPIVQDMSDVGLLCDLGRGVMETLSVSAVSTARGHRWAGHGGCSTHAERTGKRPKIRGKAEAPTPHGSKIIGFPIGRADAE